MTYVEGTLVAVYLNGSFSSALGWYSCLKLYFQLAIYTEGNNNVRASKPEKHSSVMYPNEAANNSPNKPKSNFRFLCL